MDYGVYMTTTLNPEVQFIFRLEYSEVEEVDRLTDGTANNVQSKSISDDNGILCEERIIKWQQKIENPFFVYSDQATTHSSSTSPAFAQRRLFTYINGEKPPNSSKQKFNAKKADTKFADAGVQDLSVPINTTWNSRVVPLIFNKRRNPVVDLPTNEIKRKARMVQYSTISMYIMAYLGPMEKDKSKFSIFKLAEQYDTNDEYIVLKICMLNGKIITFEPDITEGKQMLQSRYGNYMASMTIDNSCFTALHELPEEETKNPPLYGIGSFDMPEERQLQINYLIEIGKHLAEQGINFPHDEIYVEYEIETPPGVSINAESSKGCTCTSVTKPVEENDIAFFSHNFPVQLLMKSKNEGSDFFWPRILVKVCAEDLWGRYYIDGYGFTTLPQNPGRHETKIPCWRPIDLLNKKAALFEYFVSQSIDVDSLKFNGLSEVSIQTKKVSRIGLTTESSGELKLNISCILQAQNFIPRNVLRQMTYNSAIERAGLHSNLHWKIMKALIEFEKAKSQFMETRNKFLPSSEFGGNHQ